MQGRPRKATRFGGSSQHQKLMMANLVASLVAAEGIVTTEAKAKAVRPVAEKVITKAKKGGLHNYRQVLAYLGDVEMTTKLFEDVGPRYAERPGGYMSRPGSFWRPTASLVTLLAARSGSRPPRRCRN